VDGLVPLAWPTEMSWPSRRCQDFADVGMPAETLTWLLSEKKIRNPCEVGLVTTNAFPLGVVSAANAGLGNCAHLAVCVCWNS
jgi:hypothetical protein